jgi:hypothetical protein
MKCETYNKRRKHGMHGTECRADVQTKYGMEANRMEGKGMVRGVIEWNDMKRDMKSEKEVWQREKGV